MNAEQDAAAPALRPALILRLIQQRLEELLLLGAVVGLVGRDEPCSTSSMSESSISLHAEFFAGLDDAGSMKVLASRMRFATAGVLTMTSSAMTRPLPSGGGRAAG